MSEVKTQTDVTKMEERYWSELLFAAIKGYAERTGKSSCELSLGNEKEIFRFADENGFKIYHFKKKETLPRVNKVLGFLRSIYFENLLDVGSGRGVFLFPFLENFPYVEVTSVDILDKRVEMLSDIKNGGIDRLNVHKADICTQPFPAKSFDVVTLLEVLEHIPDVKKAIASAVKMAKKYIVVSVPSKEDNNPEHIHLLTKNLLTEYFNECGVTKLHFDGVNGHLLMIATINGGE